MSILRDSRFGTKPMGFHLLSLTLLWYWYFHTTIWSLTWEWSLIASFMRPWATRGVQSIKHEVASIYDDLIDGLWLYIAIRIHKKNKNTSTPKGHGRNAHFVRWISIFIFIFYRSMFPTCLRRNFPSEKLWAMWGTVKRSNPNGWSAKQITLISSTLYVGDITPKIYYKHQTPIIVLMY